MNMRAVLIVIALGIVAAVGWYFYSQPGVLPLPQQETGQGSGGEPIAAQEATYSEEEEYYSISATYPDIPVVEEAVLEMAAQFKADSNLDNLTPEDIQIQGLGGDRKYALDIEYDSYTSGEYASFALTIYSDTLGAHPNAFFRTFTFDSEDREMGLEDLFEAGAPYLSRVSEKVYAGVMAQLEARGGGSVMGDAEETVRIGTSPTPETLQFFYLDGNALHILIPPYQAASWAAGSFDIEIPLAELEDISR